LAKKKAKVISVMNYKGGVGKTTSTYNLGAALAFLDYNVLMIDNDSQGSLTISAGYELGDARIHGKNTVNLYYELDNDPMENVITPLEEMPTLHLIPTNKMLQTADEETREYNFEQRLRMAVDQISDQYDYILIDCGPTPGKLTRNALAACDSVVIPVRLDFLSYKGLQAMEDDIVRAKKQGLNRHIYLQGIIGTFYKKVGKEANTIAEIVAESGNMLGIVNEATEVTKKVVDGKPIVFANPKSRTAQQYADIATMIITNKTVNVPFQEFAARCDNK